MNNRVKPDAKEIQEYIDQSEMYNVRLYFDDQIMYSNDYYDDEIDLPF